MNEEKKTLGGTAIKPVGWDRTGLEKFQYFLYDPDTGAFLSRTPSSWVKIILFYSIYYSLLTIFWVSCLQVFFMTLPNDSPKWTLDESIIGSNPGLGLRPRMQDSRIDSSMYVLAAGSKDTVPTNPEGEGSKNIDYAVRMKHFLDVYQNQTGLDNCSSDANQVRVEGERNCIFDISVLAECGEYPYGYLVNQPETNVAEPCILLKFNKIWNWSPKPVDESKLDNPEYDTMSENLKTRILKSMDKNYVWVDCAGRNPADRESVRFEYLPANQGIPLKYFPYRGNTYHTPLVAIKLRQVGEPIYYGQLIHLECRAWFDGVIHDTKDKLGLVQFELQLQPMN